ncbi:anti-sigma-D factor RsdA [Williamsia maris]|uniref:Anti-sigma-D factor RsdA to sigma factor binding region n=1 Tax=Williamsia maris TaxID=72806 RepID=A0ABT1H7Z1_9NOCA|nr:anti-sigma-D factor RsdA [Williamsia maris]MCP2174387.1 Anti-sigma-D factor RsdA to sigma factor binding region [Williamsia maris]
MNDRDYPVSSPEDPDDATPIDLASLRADDRLLDALSRNQVPGSGLDGSADYQLASLLAEWRHEIDARPMPIGPTLDEVEAEIARTRRAGSRHTTFKRLRVLSGAAAVAVVAFGAITVLAQNSNPGDPLWQVKEAMFGSAASQTVASANAQSNLEKAEQALSSGDNRQAAQLVADAQKQVGGMSGNDARQRMQDWVQRLATQVGPIPDNPLTSLTSLPSVSGLPPLQLPSDVVVPTIPSNILQRQREMQARINPSQRPTKQTTRPSSPVTTTPQAPPSSSTPADDETTTTTTTTTPSSGN